MPLPDQLKQQRYLRILTPLTRDGINLLYDAGGKMTYKETFLPITARKYITAENSQFDASNTPHLKHIIEDVFPEGEPAQEILQQMAPPEPVARHPYVPPNSPQPRQAPAPEPVMPAPAPVTQAPRNSPQPAAPNRAPSPAKPAGTGFSLPTPQPAEANGAVLD